jgi:hypothetical protein
VLSTDQKVGGSNPSERATVMSRDTVDMRLGTSLHFGPAVGECDVVLVGVKAVALWVACGQP